MCVTGSAMVVPSLTEEQKSKLIELTGKTRHFSGYEISMVLRQKQLEQYLARRLDNREPYFALFGVFYMPDIPVSARVKILAQIYIYYWLFQDYLKKNNFVRAVLCQTRKLEMSQ